MKSKELKVRILEASNNHWLTQRRNVGLLDRVFTKVKILKPSEGSADWREIDNEELEYLKKQRDEWLAEKIKYS
jgi:hypothetical protein